MRVIDKCKISKSKANLPLGSSTAKSILSNVISDIDVTNNVTLIDKSSTLETLKTAATLTTTNIVPITTVTSSSSITTTATTTIAPTASASATTSNLTNTKSQDFSFILDNFINKFSSDSSQKLTCLNLSFCSLKLVPHQISKLTCLKNLNLSCNELTCINLPIPNGTVESLALSFNQISINEETFKSINRSFTCLTKLNLSFNRNADQNDLRLRIDFSDFPSLRELNVSGIFWRNLRGIKGNSIVERFYLHTSSLIGLPSLVGFESCSAIDLSNNEINFDRRTIQRIVRYLPLLRHLDISGNLKDSNPSFCWTDKWSKVEMIKIKWPGEQVKMAMSNKCLNSTTALNVIDFRTINDTTIEHRNKGMLISLITGTTNANQLALSLKGIFETQFLLSESWRTYMKNALLSCYKFLTKEQLSSKENIDSVNKKTESTNIILCYIVTELNQVKVRLSYYGHDVKVRLINSSCEPKQDDSSKLVDSLEDSSSTSYLTSTTSEGDIISQSNGLPSTIDPFCQEIILTENDDILFLGINFLLNEEKQLGKMLQGKGLSLHDKLKRYTELESSARNTDNIMAFALQKNPPSVLSSSSEYNETSSMEFTEKDKSWECIVAANQNFEYNRRLIVMPLAKSLLDFNQRIEKEI